MKNLIALILLFLVTTICYGQKLKGSKAVTTSQREIANFESIDIGDQLEVFLVQGDKCALEIEADDNLHDAITHSESAGTLRLGIGQEISGAKKLSVKITHTGGLKMIIAKGKSTVTALGDIEVDDLTVKTFESSKFLANVKAAKFTMMANDKSDAQLNLIATTATIELSKNSNLKALISSNKLTFDMYQKSTAVIEGDIIDLKLRLDNNANFTGKNLTSKDARLFSEDYSNCSIMVTATTVITMGGKSEIELYGEPKIEVEKFADSAVLKKRTSTKPL